MIIYKESQEIGMSWDKYTKSDQDSLGLIYSVYTHVEYWEILK